MVWLQKWKLSKIEYDIDGYVALSHFYQNKFLHTVIFQWSLWVLFVPKLVFKIFKNELFSFETQTFISIFALSPASSSELFDQSSLGPEHYNYTFD